jgi:SAM-dependent methyltransferase
MSYEHAAAGHRAHLREDLLVLDVAHPQSSRIPADLRLNTAPPRVPVTPMLIFSVATFLSAFLLFEVQLVIARLLLPRFGGSAAVWTTCLLFFQVLLVIGYLYSHWSVRRLQPRQQVLLHVSLLALSMLTLPIGANTAARTMGEGSPVLGLLGLLAISVGLPYVLLSTTSPLLQAWYVRVERGEVPYRLFALSNAGSMLGLLSYPVLIEPYLSLRGQTWSWSGAYVVFILLCALCGSRSLTGAFERHDAARATPRPRVLDAAFWLVLSACPSGLLMAVTNHLTQNVAPIPFLWVLPLTLYLLTFVVCFTRDGGWYRRALFLPLAVPALAGMAYLVPQLTVTLPVLICSFSGGFFVCCMLCHGELARHKPDPTHLTFYYLMVSLGGAVGGVFVGLIAPRIFRGFFEFQTMLAVCALLVAAILFRDWLVQSDRKRLQLLLPVAALAFALAFAAYLAVQVRGITRDALAMTRNFYGVLTVKDWDRNIPWIALREMIHGTTPHGTQFLSPERRRQPTTYFGSQSGIGLTLLGYRPQATRRVGVVGLGTGTIAAYGRPGDLYRYYEINPQAIDIAKTFFTYVGDSGARVEIIPGDARLSMEREPPQEYDVLVIDAFSSGSIPVHFLTLEAFQLYKRHLRSGGVLAMHISNAYLDLSPVVLKLARAMGWMAALVPSPPDDAENLYAAEWVLVSGEPGFFRQPFLWGRAQAIKERSLQLWTDDYSNLFQVLR